MSTTEREINDFSDFAISLHRNGGSDLSIDELFDIWRTENPSEALYAEGRAATNASIQDFKNGERGTVAGEHSDQLRQEFGREIE